MRWYNEHVWRKKVCFFLNKDNEMTIAVDVIKYLEQIKFSFSLHIVYILIWATILLISKMVFSGYQYVTCMVYHVVNWSPSEMLSKYSRKEWEHL